MVIHQLNTVNIEILKRVAKLYGVSSSEIGAYSDKLGQKTNLLILGSVATLFLSTKIQSVWCEEYTRIPHIGIWHEHYGQLYYSLEHYTVVVFEDLTYLRESGIWNTL